MFAGSLSRNLLERVGDDKIDTARRSRLVSRVKFHDSSNKVCDVRLVDVPVVVGVLGEIVSDTNISCQGSLSRSDLSLKDCVWIRNFESNTTVSEERPRY